MTLGGVGRRGLPTPSDLLVKDGRIFHEIKAVRGIAIPTPRGRWCSANLHRGRRTRARKCAPNRSPGEGRLKVVTRRGPPGAASRMRPDEEGNRHRRGVAARDALRVSGLWTTSPFDASLEAITVGAT